MNDSRRLENERDQQVRIQCIDYATRIVGKPEYLLNNENNKWEKYQEDVVKVAKRIYGFVMHS